MSKILITNAGIAEIVNAEQSGTGPVKIVSVGYGTGRYSASAGQTQLREEFKRVTAVAGGAIGPNVIHMTARDDSEETYSVYELGVYTEKGTLLAVVSQDLPILQKARMAQSLIAIDIAVTDFDASSVTFGDTNFSNPPATTERQGVVRLGTISEVMDGSSTLVAVTPKALHEAVLAACTEFVPPGQIVMYAGTSVPEGFLLCNGGAVSRTKYARLFAAIGTKWGEGDKSTTFNLPPMHRRFAEFTTTVSEVGQLVEAGLPDIKGGPAGGVLSYGSNAPFIATLFEKKTAVDSGTFWDLASLSFDARLASSIYGSSMTVQPSSVRLLPIIRV